ncbi:hypothetical protein CMO92_03505 [Candidatus Woesearchaeota archaeon]|nr:hypothetical protein [Candidatus Woesearchaeota archaeon]
MSNRYYLDTCIWRDYYENREDRFRPLGQWAFEFFRMVKETESRVLTSDLIVDELSKAYNQTEILKIFKILSDEALLENVKTQKKQVDEAARLKRERKSPFGDLLHAILARDNGAILITRDKHFVEFEDIVSIRKPEDLI